MEGGFGVNCFLFAEQLEATDHQTCVEDGIYMWYDKVVRVQSPTAFAMGENRWVLGETPEPSTFEKDAA